MHVQDPKKYTNIIFSPFLARIKNKNNMLNHGLYNIYSAKYEKRKQNNVINLNVND